MAFAVFLHLALALALEPLPPVRKCYVGSISPECQQLLVLQGGNFSRNRYGHETTAQRRCLTALRQVKGNTFRLAPGRCELWRCATRQALQGRGHEVFSELCEYQELEAPRRSPVFVKLWEWNYEDVALECETFLGPNGFDAVQLSPVTEHKRGPEWWTKYQPVSFALSSRSGSLEDFAAMVARCRAVGVEVIVDLILNHIATPCRQGRGTHEGTPCVGWNGTAYGNRRLNGSYLGWDKAGPELFNHLPQQPFENCKVGPPSWTCRAGSIDVTDCSCCSCDFLKLPDWNTALPEVYAMHLRHVHELHDLGVTMLRLDLALFESVLELSHVLNTVPWHLVYQEWWWESPKEQRHKYVGHVRDITYRYKLTHYLGNSSLEKLPDLFTLTRGHDEIAPETAVYPMAFHDGRSWKAKPGNATYKNGLEYHQQQKFMLAWPKGGALMLWGGFAWARMSDGPPGCDARSGLELCRPEPVYVDGEARCMATPRESPLVEKGKRGYVCEHRWEGVAGLIDFRKACRGLPVSRTWQAPELTHGRLAFRAGQDCFAALVRGYNEKLESVWGHLGHWHLKGLQVGLPSGRYCDLGSLDTLRGWDRRSCPRQVVIGLDGRILSGVVLEGDLLAIHVQARLS